MPNTVSYVTHLDLLEKIKAINANIGVIGLGYVGLPLAIEFAGSGFKVQGFDLDEQKINKIKRGISYVSDVTSETILEVTNNNYFDATTDFSLLYEMDVIFICVPTPFTKTKDPDLSYIESATDQIVNNQRVGQLVILESTTYPGTTEEKVLVRLEEKGLEVGKDFFLAFSPERVDPGNKKYNIKNTPKVVGGVTKKCTQIATELYSKIIGRDYVYPVKDPKVAELTKLLENTFRSVNIALVNELSLLCRRMNIDVWDVIDAAATKPFGYMPFYPGPGVGGHCIPIDPYYLSWKAREYDFDTKFIQLAADINNDMPKEIVHIVSDVLNDEGVSLKGSSVLVIGASFKKDISDTRHSASIRVMDILLSKGVFLQYFDPYVPVINFGEHEDVRYSKRVVLESKSLTKQLVEDVDCVVILTDHSDVNYELIVNHANKVIDTKNILKNFTDKNNIVKL